MHKCNIVKPYLAAGNGGTVVGALLPVRHLLGVQRVVAGADVGGLIDNTGGCSGGGGGGCCCCGWWWDITAGARLISQGSHLTDHLVENLGVVGDPRHPGGGACAREDNVGVGVVVGLPAVARGPVRHDGVVARAGAPLLDQLTVAVAEDVVGCHPGVVVSPKVVT